MKLTDKKNTKELMLYLLKEMVRVAAARWYGNVLQKEEGDILKKILIFEITGKRKRKRL